MIIEQLDFDKASLSRDKLSISSWMQIRIFNATLAYLKENKIDLKKAGKPYLEVAHGYKDITLKRQVIPLLLGNDSNLLNFDIKSMTDALFKRTPIDAWSIALLDIGEKANRTLAVHVPTVKEFDLCLMSDLVYKKPEYGKLYLNKEGKRLKYLFLDIKGNKVEDFLDISITGSLTKEILATKKSDIFSLILKKHFIKEEIVFELTADGDVELKKGFSNITLYLELAGQLRIKKPLKYQALYVKAREFKNTGQLEVEQLVLKVKQISNEGFLLTNFLKLQGEDFSNTASAVIKSSDIEVAVEISGNKGFMQTNQLLFTEGKHFLNEGALLVSKKIELNALQLENRGVILAIYPDLKGNQAVVQQVLKDYLKGMRLKLSVSPLEKGMASQPDSVLQNTAVEALKAVTTGYLNEGNIDALSFILQAKESFKNLAFGKICSAHFEVFSDGFFSNNGVIESREGSINTTVFENLAAGKIQVKDGLAIDGVKFQNHGLIQSINLNLTIKRVLENTVSGKITAVEAMLSSKGFYNQGNVEVSSFKAIVKKRCRNLPGAEIAGSEKLEFSMPKLENNGVLSGKLLVFNAPDTQPGNFHQTAAGRIVGNTIQGNFTEVYNAGNIAVHEGICQLSAIRRWENPGRVQTRGSLELATPELQNTGILAAAKTIKLVLDELKNRGIITAQASVALLCANAVEEAGKPTSQLRQLLQEYQKGKILEGKSLEIIAQLAVENQGVLSGNKLTLTTLDAIEGMLKNQLHALIISDNAIKIKTAKIYNAGNIITKKLDLQAMLLDNQRQGFLNADEYVNLDIQQGKNAGNIQAPQFHIKVKDLLENFKGGKIIAFKNIKLGGVDLCLMSELLSDEELKSGKMYLDKQEEQLKYIVINPKGAIVEGLLDINLEGALTKEFLNSRKSDILDITSKRDHTQLESAVIHNSGSFESAGDIECSAKSLIQELPEAKMASGKQLSITADIIQNVGVLIGDTLQLKAKDYIKNLSFGKIGSTQGMRLESQVFQQEGDVISEGDITIQTQHFSHLSGRIKAKGNVIIHARDIHCMSYIEAEGDIEFHHDGGKWEVADKLYAKGVVRFFSPDSSAIAESLALTLPILHNSSNIEASEAVIKVAVFENLATGKLQLKNNLVLNAAKFHNQGLVRGTNLHLTIEKVIENTVSGRMAAGQTVLTSETCHNFGAIEASVFKGNCKKILKNLLGAEITGSKSLAMLTPHLENSGTLSSKLLVLNSPEALGHFQNLVGGRVISGTVEGYFTELYNAGNIAVEEDVIALTVALLWNNMGRMQTQGLLELATQKIENTGILSAAKKIKLTVNDIKNTGIITAQASAALLCANAVEEGGKPTPQLEQLLQEYQKGKILEGKSLEITAQLVIENQGVVSGANLTLTALDAVIGMLKNQPTALISSGNTLTIAAAKIENAGEISARQVDIKNTIVLENLSSGKILVDRLMTFHGNKVLNNGVIHALGILQVEAETILQSSAGKIMGQQELRLTVKNSLENNGQLIGEKVTLTASGQVKNDATGIILAKNLLALQTECFQQEGEVISEGDIHIRTRRFSHTLGRIKAKGNVIIYAEDIECLESIEADGDIEFHHGGGQWEVSDKLRAKGTVRFFWPEGRDIETAFTMVGGLHYELAKSAKQPLRFLANQHVMGDFKIVQPMAFTLGSPQQFLSLLSEQGILIIEAPHIYAVNARLAGMKGLKLQASGDLQLGIPVHSFAENRSAFQQRRARFFHGGLGKKGRVDSLVGVYRNSTLQWQKPLHYSVALMSGGDIVLTGTHILWNHLEIVGLGNMFVTGQQLNDIASDVKISKHAVFEVPAIKSQVLTEVKNLTGQIASFYWQDSAQSHRRLYEQKQVITRQPFWSIGGELQLPSQGQTVLIGSEVQCFTLKGPIPKTYSVETYVTYANYGLFSAHKNPWWVVCEGVAVGTPIIGKCSHRILQTESPVLNITGIVSAQVIELKGIREGHVGWNLDLPLPAPKPFRSYIPLMDFEEPSVLFEMTEPGTYPTVYRPILPLPFTESLDPILIASPEGLRPNIHHRRPLFTPYQEQALIEKALMGELGRGFLGTETASEETLKLLRDNTAQFAQSTALIPRDGNISLPLIVHNEIECIHASKEVEFVLVPGGLYLPKTYDNPRLRDWAGGLFSLGNMLLQGVKDATLTIKAHVDAKAVVTFSTFNRLTQERRMIKEKVSVYDTTTQSSFGGLRKKKHTDQRWEEKSKSEPDNTTTGVKVVYENINLLQHIGLTINAGHGGVRTENVQIIEQRALIETGIRTEIIQSKGLLSKNTMAIHEPVQTLIPTTIRSTGQVQLNSQVGYFDNLMVNNKLITLSSHDAVSASHLIIGETPRLLKEEERARAAEKREMQRTLKRKQKQGDIKFLISLPIAYYAAGVAGGLTGAKGATLAAVKGITMGFTGALVRGNNPLKGGINGALFSLVGYGVVQIESIATASEIVQEVAVGAAAGALQTILHKGNLIENMVTGGIINGVAAFIVPNPNAGTKQGMPLETGIARAMVQATVSTVLSNSSWQSFAVNLTGSMIGASLGDELTQKGKKHGHQMRLQQQSLETTSKTALQNYPKKTSGIPANNKTIWVQYENIVALGTEYAWGKLAEQGHFVPKAQVKEALQKNLALQGKVEHLPVKLEQLGHAASKEPINPLEAMTRGFGRVVNATLEILVGTAHASELPTNKTTGLQLQPITELKNYQRLKGHLPGTKPPQLVVLKESKEQSQWMAQRTMEKATRETLRILALHDIQVSKEQVVKLLKRHPDLQVPGKTLEERLVTIGRLDAKRMGSCSQEEALRRGVGKWVFYNITDFTEGVRDSKAVETPSKPSLELRKNTVEKSQQQRLEKINQFFEVKPQANMINKINNRQGLSIEENSTIQKREGKREWHPILFSGKNNGAKTRVTRDSKGQWHYHDYETLKYKQSPFKAKSFGESPKQGLPISFSLASWKSEQETLIYDITRSKEFGNEHLHGSIGFTPYASAKGHAKIKHTKDTVSANASGNAGFGVNIGTLSVKTQYITGQGDMNVLSGQADGRASVEIIQGKKIEINLGASADIELIGVKMTTKLQIPLAEIECTANMHGGIGVSSAFSIGHFTYKTRANGGQYIQPKLKLGVISDYDVACKPNKLDKN